MTPFLVDTNVALYSVGRGPRAEACRRVLEAVSEGAPGRMTTAVLEEIWHLELSARVPGLTGLADSCLTMFSPLLAVTEHCLRIALDLDAPDLGANDRVLVGTGIVAEVGIILSADTGFDEVARIWRVDPEDRRAVDSLLA